jgi:hypothetical protein
MWTGMEGAGRQAGRSALHTEKAIIGACNLAVAPPVSTIRLHKSKHPFTLLQKSTMDGLFLQMFVFIFVANFS